MSKQDKNNTNKAEYTDTVRKLQRTGRAGASYMVTIPKEMMDELGWRERQKVEFEKDGDRLIITDWEE